MGMIEEINDHVSIEHRRDSIVIHIHTTTRDHSKCNEVIEFEYQHVPAIMTAMVQAASGARATEYLQKHPDLLVAFLDELRDIKRTDIMIEEHGIAGTGKPVSKRAAAGAIVRCVTQWMYDKEPADIIKSRVTTLLQTYFGS